MRYLVSASEMKLYDSNTIERIGIPACVLMERAALAVAEAVEEYLAGQGNKGVVQRKSVLVMAGMGNNGGDGLAAARLLSQKGCQVEVWCVGSRDRASAQWKQQAQILKHYPVEQVEKPGRCRYDILIDALFGVGLSREISGEYREAVEIFQGMEGWKLALDLPSGIHSDTGKVLGQAVKADKTVTFGFCKRGLVLYPGCLYAGQVQTADIGISPLSFLGREPEMYAYEGDPVSLMPRRKPEGNKGTFGKVLLAAGSLNMAGAAVLAARGAYRTGAGMVKVITPGENRVILQCGIPEALLGSGEDLADSMDWADVFAAGPGLGQGQQALSWLEQMISEGKKPLVIDADGLNLLASRPRLRGMLALQGKAGRKIILTPHVGELARLTGKTIEECRENLFFYGRELAKSIQGVVAAKDARSFICAEGHAVCVNLTGSSGMAVAGSGDVLTGVIAGLLAQGEDAFEAAAKGAYLHGAAGDRVVARKGEYACMAGDIAEEIGIG